jgi:hypothetical protein
VFWRRGVMAWSGGGAVAKKRTGRPKSSTRKDVSIKFDQALARKARMISEGLNISMAEYLSEMTRQLIDRDYAKLMRKLEEGGEK